MARDTRPKSPARIKSALIVHPRAHTSQCRPPTTRLPEDPGGLVAKRSPHMHARSHPFRYWSEGELEMERTAESEPRETRKPDADSVYIHRVFGGYPCGRSGNLLHGVAMESAPAVPIP